MKPKVLPAYTVSRETRTRLTTFAALLQVWNARINLVANPAPHIVWHRHIDDSLQLLPLLLAPGPLVDFGSGAGFPGLVLAIAANRPTHLVERDHRKAAFLREAARQTEAPVTVHVLDINKASVPRAGIVTARALAPLFALLEWAGPILMQNGRALFLKGRQHAAELTQAAELWNFTCDIWQSQTDQTGVILDIGNIQRR